MVKVKLTKKQAKAIEEIKENNLFTGNFELNLKIQMNKGWTVGIFTSLNELNTKEYLDALYEGYEIIEDIDVGDWVRVNWKSSEPTIHKVLGFPNKLTVTISGSQGNTTPPLSIVERATKEEIAQGKEYEWWESNGREVGELKRGDILVDWEGELFVNNEDRTVGERFRGFNSVVCFTHDRVDVKHFGE